MFDLESAIKRWKKALAANPGLEDGQRAELETCLRDEVADLVRRGRSPEDAFCQVAAEMGGADEIGAEFFKVYAKRRFGPPSWKRTGSSPALLWNYVVIALRKIKRQKGYSVINIAGLSLGLACCLLVLLWVYDELSFDRFHANIDRLYRVVRFEKASDGSVNRFAATPSPLAPTLKESYPEVVDTSRFYNLSALMGRVPLEANHQRGYETGYCFADPSFFSMWTFKFIQGDPRSAFLLPHSVVLTRKMAEKYFGNSDPMDKTLSIIDGADYTVTGIIENIPRNSHLQFDFLSPIGPLIDKYAWMQRWNIPHFFTYILMGAKADARELNEKIKDHLRRFDPEFSRNSGNQYQLQPVKDIHLRSQFQADLGGVSTFQSGYVLFFSAIAAFVLIIACINFINLTTARSADRAKEIAVRKVAGATRREIAQQFFGESLICSFAALCLAIILVITALPMFNALSGKQLVVESLLKMDVLLGIVGIAAIAGLIAGLYPAMLLSSVQPVHALKGRMPGGLKKRDFRYLLVVVQFSVSLILIIGTVVVYRQMTYIQHAKLGYTGDCLLSIATQRSRNNSYAAFKEALLGNPQVLGVTASSDLPTGTNHFTVVSGWEGSSTGDSMLMSYFSVDEDYRDTFDLELAGGRFFSKSFPADAAEGFVLNEEAVKRMGMPDPLGKRFLFYGRTGRIIGVVKDYHFESLHRAIEPLILWINPGADRYAIVRIRTDRIEETIRFLEDTHRRFNPAYPFEFHYLDDEIAGLYRNETRTKQILQFFSGFAIFISCIGLYGLAALTVAQRTKETGIRKVMGAKISQLAVVLSKRFVDCVLIANVIGIPAAYWIMSLWLRKFAYRFEYSLWIFLLPGLFVLGLTLFTVGFHTLKTARSNPVNCLRHE